MRLDTCPFKEGRKYLATDGHKYKCCRVKELESYWVLVFTHWLFRYTTTYNKEVYYIPSFVEILPKWGDCISVYIGEED